MSMAEVILKGSTNAPAQGKAGAFYGKQFVFSYVDWLIKVSEVLNHANSSNPPLMTKKIRKGNFVYLYEMNKDGQWESRYFTVAEIANGVCTNEYPVENADTNPRDRGIMKAPNVPGCITGAFHRHQYIRTPEELKRTEAIADAYIGDKVVSIYTEEGYRYWYLVDDKTGDYHSMFMTYEGQTSENRELHEEDV